MELVPPVLSGSLFSPGLPFSFSWFPWVPITTEEKLKSCLSVGGVDKGWRFYSRHFRGTLETKTTR